MAERPQELPLPPTNTPVDENDSANCYSANGRSDFNQCGRPILSIALDRLAEVKGQIFGILVFSSVMRLSQSSENVDI